MGIQARNSHGTVANRKHVEKNYWPRTIIPRRDNWFRDNSDVNALPHKLEMFLWFILNTLFNL